MSEEGANSSRSLPHRQGLGAVRADDGDNLFLLSRPLGGIIIPTAAWILKHLHVHVQCRQGTAGEFPGLLCEGRLGCVGCE